MKKHVWLVAALVVTSFLISTAYAPPHSVLGKLLGFWGKRPEKLLCIKRDLDNNAFVTVFNGKVVKAYKFPKNGPMEEMESTLTYDVEKLKEIKGDAGWAHKQFMEWSEMAGKEPLIRAVSLDIDAEGTLKFQIHIYSSTNDYRGAWPVDAKTWKWDKDKIDPTDEGNPMHQVWAVDKVKGEEKSGEAEAKAAPQEQSAESAEGEGEAGGGGRRGGRRGGVREQ